MTKRRRNPGLILAMCGALACVVVARSQDSQPPDPPAEPEPQPATVGTEVLIVLKDGRRFTGTLVERTDERFVLDISGIQTTLATDEVDRIQVQLSVEEQYLALRASIDDRDSARLLMLAKWLVDRKRYQLALDEVARVLASEPENHEARKMRTVIEAQWELASKARPQQPDEPADPARPIRDFPRLTPEQVNIIKVFEVDLADPPRMVIEHETIQKLIDGNPGHPLIPSTREGREALMNERPEKILDLMFQLRARDLYPEVRVIDHPRPMRLFRETVHRGWLVNACMTTRCHGGEEAGRLALYNRRENTDETVYTNFLILDRFRLDDGTPLIDYKDPTRSPLLHLGLHREPALYKHPVVPTASGRGDLWKPVFQDTNDRRFAQAVEWIRSMYSPRPEYPIRYTPPKPSSIPQRPADDAVPGGPR